MGVKVRYHRGAWWLFIAHQNKRRSKRVGDKATALEVAKRVRERLALGDFTLLGTDTETLKVYAERWRLDGAGSRKASTRRYYAFNLSLHIYPVIGERPIGAISRADCRKLITECRAKGLKLASLQGVQRTLSAVLSQAVEDGILSANPAFRMGKHLRRGDEPKAPIRPLTRDESETLLKTVLAHWPEHYAFFLMALRTGMRLGELLAVQWGDLDFANRCIEVQRNLVGGRLTTPKNHNRRRVDMSAHLAETLERRATAAKAEALKAGEDRPTWVFTNSEGEPLDGDNFRRRVFEKALTKAKLRHARIHDLRHTFASQLIQNGESLAYVRDQMGHGSITITVNTYSHLVPGSNRAAVDRLDATPIRIPAASGEQKARSRNRRK